MVKKIYVGNLPFSATEEELRELFEQHGQVQSVSIITDRETGRSRGFGFVEMEAASADDAIAALDQAQMGGRSLSVSEARARPERGGGGGRDRDRGGDRDRGDRDRGGRGRW